MTDLNQAVHRSSGHAETGSTEVWFDDIAQRLCALIQQSHSVVGAMAWLTDKDILQALQDRPGGVALVVTNDSPNRKESPRYRQLPLLPEHAHAVRMLGAGRGRGRPFMHHKFMVGLDRHGKTLWCSTGSYNGTRNSRRSIENVLVSRDADLATAYRLEWEAVWEAARPVPAARPSRPRKRRRLFADADR